MSRPFPSAFEHNASNVGIHAMDIYFPNTYISLAELEKHNGVSAGKYTIGLGQQELAFVNDREDIYSVTLTAVSNFMKKFNIGYDQIGRLEVGSETILDHSKSIKSVLMQLFESSGNTDIEGIDCMNACYGGTHALFNSIDWVESSSFDGRYAMVVAADIAEYAAGPARPTGGCGAVIMLIGPDAPLVFDRGVRSTHMEHAWDFYKPNMESPYPIVDGKFSNSCYLRALDKCYSRYNEKFNLRSGQTVTAASFDHVVLHAPYNKLTQKAYARLHYTDYQHDRSNPAFASLKAFDSIDLDASYNDVPLEKALIAISRETYPNKVGPATLLPQRVGNMYTASLYAGILSLMGNEGAHLVGRRVLCFSYGSGLASSMFSFSVPAKIKSHKATLHLAGQSTSDAEIDTAAMLASIKSKLDLQSRLAARTELTCEVFEQWMGKREKLHSLASFKADDSIDTLVNGTYYLVEKDAQSRRQYECKGVNQHADA